MRVGVRCTNVSINLKKKEANYYGTVTNYATLVKIIFWIILSPLMDVLQFGIKAVVVPYFLLVVVLNEMDLNPAVFPNVEAFI
jgi:hypothetical protein